MRRNWGKRQICVEGREGADTPCCSSFSFNQPSCRLIHSARTAADGNVEALTGEMTSGKARGPYIAVTAGNKSVYLRDGEQTHINAQAHTYKQTSHPHAASTHTSTKTGPISNTGVNIHVHWAR